MLSLTIYKSVSKLIIGGMLFLSSSILIADELSGSELPELGDSATRVLSPDTERQIGQQFMRELLRDSSYIGDPELNAYLNQLGDNIAQHAALRGTDIRIHLINQSELNAFAVPGGHITFHTGLLLATDDESELAAVMAHEIAHVSQRHLPRMIAKLEASKLPAAAAILAAILVGGQEGLAGITVAQAALISNQLAYTREFEREADAIGIKLLAQSKFDPHAMGRFFGKLERYGGLGDKDAVPEFLRTHPLSHSRIAEAEHRVSQYPKKVYPSNRGFLYARAKIRALFSPKSDNPADYFTQRIAKNTGADRAAAIYGLAIVQQNLRQYTQARATLNSLDAIYKNDMPVQVAAAEIELAAGNSGLAAASYEKITAQHTQPYLTHYHANALLAAGDAAAAKQVIRHKLRRDKTIFTLYPLLAKANGALGLLGEAHQATAEFHVALGEYQRAKNSLQQALRQQDTAGYLQQSITARLAEIERLIAARNQ